MDAMPPTPVHCEAPAQDVLLRVSGEVDSRDFDLFTKDVQVLDGSWTLISDNVAGRNRTFVLRAHSNVTYNSVSDASENAKMRGWTVHVTFDEPRCTV